MHVYATVTGLQERKMASDEASIEAGLMDVERRLCSFILPRVAETEIERKAVENAVYSQYIYEQSDAARQVLSMPVALASLSIGSFSASVKAPGRREGELFPAGIAQDVRAELLLAGLLYKGGVSE